MAPHPQDPRSAGHPLALVTEDADIERAALGTTVARRGYDAMTAAKDHVIAATREARLISAAALVAPEPMKAESHRTMAEPGSGNGRST